MMVTTAIRITGSIAVRKLIPKPGISLSLNRRVAPREAIFPSFKGVRNNALAEFIQYRAAKNKGWNADNDTVYQYQSYISAIFLAITVGPGCGGKKPCATSKPESIGTHINIGDIFASRAIANKIGTRRIKPTSKKSAIPTINAEQTTAQSSLFSRNNSAWSALFAAHHPHRPASDRA